MAIVSAEKEGWVHPRGDKVRVFSVDRLSAFWVRMRGGVSMQEQLGEYSCGDIIVSEETNSVHCITGKDCTRPHGPVIYDTAHIEDPFDFYDVDNFPLSIEKICIYPDTHREAIMRKTGGRAPAPGLRMEWLIHENKFCCKLECICDIAEGGPDWMFASGGQNIKSASKTE